MWAPSWHPSQRASQSGCEAGRRTSIIASSASSNRPKRIRPKRPDPECAPQTSDEQLIRELNSAHLWVPDDQFDEFGLDDVAAHVARQNQAQVVDFRPGRQQRGRRQRGPAPTTLSQVDPASTALPAWVGDLKAAGFDVMGRNGELFLQRGAVAQQSTTTTTTSNSSSATSSQAGRAAPAAARPKATQQHAAAAAAAAAVPEKSLAVRLEFDPLVWQTAAEDDQSGSATPSSSTAADAWYAQPAAGSGSSSASGLPASVPSTSSTASSSSSRGQPQGSAVKAIRVNVQRRLLGFSHPEQLLSFIEGCFPAWSANGCWLLEQHHQRHGVVAAPTPAEAAAALKGVALAAKRAAYNVVQTQGLARDRRVLGLVECLRLTAPRTPQHQHPSIPKRLWSLAKAYWLQAGAAAAAAQAELLAATQQAGAQAQQSQAVSQVQLPGGAAGEVPAMGPLLAQLQSAGLQLTRQQLAAAQSLISSRQADQLRQQAFVNALWAMSSIGGPLFFEQEMEALCQVAAVGRWKLSSFELSDVLWGLANARHWSPLLPHLEAALVSAGGVAACTAPELITALWAFATLSHLPQQLLAELNSKGWCVKPMSELPAAQRSKHARSPTPRVQQEAHVADAVCGEACRLGELSSSQLSALVWSLACLQQVDSGLFRRVWCEVCRQGPSLAGDVRQLVRVQQAALAVQLEGSYGPQELYCDDGTRQLLDAAAHTFSQQSGTLQSKVHSTYQRSIATTLTKMRVMHVLEDNTTGYAVDITLPSLRVAIEADGPSHMSRTATARQGRVQLGSTAMKRRHLQGLGWSVVNVAYTDWDALQSDDQRAAFLKQQIAAARAGAA